MVQEILYVLMLMYISFEATKDIGKRYALLHIPRKRRYRHLKEGSIVSYLRYQFEIILVPAVLSLVSYRVIVALSIYLIHHHYVAELLHLVGDSTSEEFFKKWTNIGFQAGIYIGGIIGLIEYSISAKKPTNESPINEPVGSASDPGADNVKNRYFWHYMKFLKLEIPNFLQIITLVGFLSVFLDNIYLIILIPIAISWLLFLYHTNRFGEYINTQIKDPFSDLKAYNLDPDKYKWERYIAVTDLIFFLGIQSLAIYFFLAA